MVIVVQRVSRASVEVDGAAVARIGRGLLLLVGIARGDDLSRAAALARQVARMRVFPDAEGRLSLRLAEVGGEALAVSQFTLLGDFSRGNRPSFHGAAAPEEARPLVDAFVAALEAELGAKVPTGVFGADMRVSLENDGPVTFVLEA
jgi:D-tyrosyl-tRNA(Tyr) deacylase